MSAYGTGLASACRNPLSRDYRDGVGRGRFRLFELRHGQSDVLVGVDHGSWRPELPFLLAERLAATRAALVEYIDSHPGFGTALSPLPRDRLAPPIAVAMLDASSIASVGPMAAVAGAIADDLAATLSGRLGCHEFFVENGGDCAFLVREPLTVSVAGSSADFSGKVGLRLTAGAWGVATSAGRLGPSLSLGKSDACTAVGRSAAAADAWATSLGNRIGGPSDIEAALCAVEAEGGPLAVFACAGARAGYRGSLELVPVAAAKEALHEYGS